MREADTTRVRTLKQLAEAFVGLRALALALHEPMLVHLFDMALQQISELKASEE
jgi:hypothetical protein